MPRNSLPISAIDSPVKIRNLSLVQPFALFRKHSAEISQILNRFVHTGFAMARSPVKQPVVAGERFPKVRTAQRYSIIALAEVIEPVSRRRVTGWTSLISDGGCHVRAADGMAAGTIVKLRIEQAGRIFETWARVAQTVPEEGMGLAFFDTTEPQKALLRAWMIDAGREGQA